MNKAKIGTWITTYNPSALDVISKCNFDWICVDMEHSSITLEQLENLLNVLDNDNIFVLCLAFIKFFDGLRWIFRIKNC